MSSDRRDDFDRAAELNLKDELPQPSHGPSQKRRKAKRDKHHDSKTQASEYRPECPVCDFAPPLSERPHIETSMLQAIFEFFMPPVNDHPENIRRHRMLLSLGVITLSGLMTAAFGWFPGFAGFAYASAVHDIKVELLEQRIFDNRVRQCIATTPESRQFYGQKVAELLAKYQATAQAPYPLPSCAEIR